jgi:putative flippase GtrA
LNKKRFFEIVRFCLGGGTALLIYYITLYILTEFVGIVYYISAILGSILNYTTSFLFQKYWTFKNKEVKTIHKQIIFYVCLASSLSLLNSIFLYLLVQYAHLPYLLAQVFITIVLTVVSFILTKKIFARH